MAGMKRFCRLFLRAAKGLSLVLCIAMIVLWVMARFRSDSIGWAGWGDEKAGIWHGCGLKSRGGVLTAYSFTGKLMLYDPGMVGDGTDVLTPRFFHYGGSGEMGRTPSFRFETIDPRWKVPFKCSILSMPLWFLALVFAVVPVWRGMVHLRRWWGIKPPGFCAACGYDLRATPTRCPECGAEASKLVMIPG
jgi:hypothetical protein